MHEALEGLLSHLKRRTEELATLKRTVSEFDDLKSRQSALLHHALTHRDHGYTIQGHAASHRVTYQTARTDLKDLVARGFLEEKPQGRGHSKRFYASADLPKRVRCTRS